MCPIAARAVAHMLGIDRWAVNQLAYCYVTVRTK